MSHEDELIYTFFCFLVVLIFGLLFAFWGGYPRGAFTRIADLTVRVDKLETEQKRLVNHTHVGIYGRIK